MSVSFENIEYIKKRLGEKDLYIHFIIDLAFLIKKLVKAGELDFSLIIQPSSNNEWENVATLLPYLPKQLVIDHLDRLLEGFMDLNWPGSPILYGYLAEVEIKPLKASFDRVVEKAITVNDAEWVYFLLTFMESERVDLCGHFVEEIEKCRVYLTSQGFEID